MAALLRVLIVEDSDSDAELMIRHLTRAGFNPVYKQVETDEEMREVLKQEWDIILADYSLPGFNAFAALQILQESGHDLPFIVVSGTIGEDTAVAIMKAGAHDYMMKDNLVRLIPAIQRELREAEVRRDKRNSQNALIESLEQYRFLFNNMAQGVIYHDADGRIISANPAAERILGISKDKMIGLTSMDPLWRIIHENGSEFSGENHPYMVTLRTGQEVRDVVMGIFNPQAKEYRWISVNSVPQFMHGCAKPYQVFTTFNDITALKQTEQALRESENLLTKAQQIAHIGSWRLYPQTYIVEGSDELFRIFGLNREEFVFKSFINIVHPDKRDFVINTFKTSIEKSSSFDIEHWLICPDGTHKYIRTIGEPIIDQQGNTVLMVGTMQDITERKRAEEEHQKLEAQLRQAQKMEAVGQLAGGVAHDFNNLLFVISGYAELIIDQLKPGDQLYDKMQKIMKAVERSITLIRQLLLFSRKGAMQLVTINLNELIGNLLKMLRRLIGEHITLEVQPGFNLKTIFADPGQIEQILMNICVNARDAMPDGGRIRIETENAAIDSEFCEYHSWAKKGEYILLTISDTGCGIPREIQDRIFEPFFTTKEVGKGTGLGLAAVYGIVKSHQGMIHVYSEPGYGTVFKIYLPVCDKGTTAISDKEEALTPLTGGREVILLAEDEEDVRNMIVHILESSDYRVISTQDGEEAIREFEAHTQKIDLALLDIVMPKANGQKILERITAIRPELPVIFITGYSKGILEPNLSPDDKYEIVQKPCTRSNLLRKIRVALDARRK